MNQTGLWIVCIGGGLAFVLPFLIYQMMRRDQPDGMVETLKRAVRQARRPWQQEENALKELSQRVAALKKDTETKDE